jgi:hypothetical protein
MYAVHLQAKVGCLTLVEFVYWQGGTGRKYAGYRCMCDCGVEIRVRSEDLRWGKQLYCNKYCPLRHPRTLDEWLANTVRNGECMEWQGSRTSGYGRIQVRGKNVWAHREVLRLATGLEPEVCMHTCDNPRCINPAHLRPGTAQTNTADMVQKRRHVFGERNHKAKLSAQAVREIRAAYAGGVVGPALARQYGVTHGAIYAVLNNQTWKQV